MERVQLTPACSDVFFITELSRRRRATELDEGGVGSVPQLEELRVDAATLPLDAECWHRARRPRHGHVGCRQVHGAR
jgi:hypothetical protein